MSKSTSSSQRASDQGDFEVRLVSLRGDRRDAIRELRRLTGRALGELRALLDAPPGILFRGTQQEAVQLLRRATDLCALELWSGGRALEELQRSIAPGSLGPHVQRRVQAPRNERGVRFAVDDVEPTPDPVKLVSERELWLALAPGATLRHCAADRSLLDWGSPDLHPLGLSVQRAFDEHRRLRVTPDAVWLTIAMGFAQHVDLRPETLRSRLVRHEGRRTLPVPWKESWPDAVDAFAAQIAEDMGPGIRNLLSCDFTTSTELDRQVADVVLLSARRRSTEPGSGRRAFTSRLVVADFARDVSGAWWFNEAGPGSCAGTAHEAVFKHVASRLLGEPESSRGGRRRRLAVGRRSTTRRRATGVQRELVHTLHVVRVTGVSGKRRGGPKMPGRRFPNGKREGCIKDAWAALSELESAARASLDRPPCALRLVQERGDSA